MAQLTGVQTLGNSTIIYEGNTYTEAEAPAQVDDIVRSDYGYSFMPKDTYYLVDTIGNYYDRDGDYYGNAGEDGETTLFRRVADSSTTPLTTAQLIAQKRAELADLEAKLAEESRPKVGDYARTLVRSHNNHLPKGTIVKVTEDDQSTLPFRVKAFNIDRTDWVREIEVITPAEAKAVLIAQIEALFGRE